MPAFNGNGFLTHSIGLGDTATLFSASDSLTAPVNSIVVCILQSGPTVRGVRQFQIGFASAPTAVVEIFGSNNAPTTAGPDPGGQLLYTSTNTQNDYYTDGTAFAFYWAKLVSQSAGGALTVTMHQV
jgi:hypothetical protein